MFPEFAPLNPGRKYLDMRGWEADERPEPRSLGLLPSGPDPVGEWLAHRQPPGPYIGRGGGESNMALFFSSCRRGGGPHEATRPLYASSRPAS
jgi:hypothetical protein